jgi:non-ribosomal peptide synthetase component F
MRKSGGNPGLIAALFQVNSLWGLGLAVALALSAAAPAVSAGMADSPVSSDTSVQLPAGERLALFGFGSKDEAPKPPPPPKPKDLFCPKVQVQSGTAAHIVYEHGREGEPLGVRYQVRFGEFARECIDLGAEIGIRVGVSARALVGPVGTPGHDIDVPIRFVVLDDKQQVVISRVTRLRVTIPQGQNGVTFTHVEELGSVPFPGESFRKWEIRVGFETKPPGGPQG